MLYRKGVVFAVTFALVVFGNSTAKANFVLSASSSSGPSTTSEVLATTELPSGNLSWTIPGPANREAVIFDPTAGPWIKEFQGPTGQSFAADDDIFSTTQTTFLINEFVTVAPDTIAWTDWHVEIGTVGWELTAGNLNQAQAFLPDGTLVGFSFDPSGVLPPASSLRCSRR